MRIEVVTGIGQGPTELAAFDAAEIGTGLSSSNLIQLSSMIPPGADVVMLDGPTTLAPRWGDRVYCAMANARTSQKGSEVWAGIGWIMLDGGKEGIFAEHEGSSSSAVERKLHDSLMAFMKNRGLEPDESLIQMKVTGTTCVEASACALVCAVYKAESW
jgi:arginine decarboxylase